MVNVMMWSPVERQQTLMIGSHSSLAWAPSCAMVHHADLQRTHLTRSCRVHKVRYSQTTLLMAACIHASLESLGASCRSPENVCLLIGSTKLHQKLITHKRRYSWLRVFTPPSNRLLHHADLQRTSVFSSGPQKGLRKRCCSLCTNG
jgi:hypothetical protein